MPRLRKIDSRAVSGPGKDTLIDDEAPVCTCPKCGKAHAHLQAGKPPSVADVDDLCQCPECGRMHRKPLGIKETFET